MVPLVVVGGMLAVVGWYRVVQMRLSLTSEEGRVSGGEGERYYGVPLCL